MGWASGYFPLLIVTPGSGFTGLFAYSPGPGLGNLISSIAAANGTDPYGNAYLGGTTSYLANAGGYLAINLNGQTLTFTGNGTYGAPYTTLGGTLNMDLATGLNLQATAQGNILLTATASPGNIQAASPIQLLNNAGTGNPTSGANIFATASSAFLQGTAGPARKFQVGEAPSTNVTTVTQTAFTNLSNATIVTGNTQTGDTYRFHVAGYGTWGSTQQTLTLQPRFGAAATNVVGSPVSIDGTALAASAAFLWSATVTLINLTQGAAATWIVLLEGTLDQVANNLIPGTPANGTIPFVTGSGSTDVILDSTVNEALGLSAMWASATGAPTISKRVSWLEKIR